MSRRNVPQVQRDLGANLREARARRGWSLAGVEAHSYGRWSSVAVGSYERGDRAITIPRLVELAAFYGVPVASLIPGAGDEDVHAQAAALDACADRLRIEAERLRKGAS